MKKTLKIIIAIGVLTLLISGCSITPNINTSIQTYPTETPFSMRVLSDADQNSVHYFGSGNHRIYNNNYRHAFGIAALSTQQLGYKYFRIIDNEELLKQFKARNVKDARSAIDSCTQGEGSYTTVSFFGNVTLCNSIVNTYSQKKMFSNALDHAEIILYIEMSEKMNDDHVTFSAEDVLAQEDVKLVLKKYPYRLEEIKTFLLKYKKSEKDSIEPL
ncbi:hypothetical protein MNB_SM-4-1693 [hydrothermal vent metagenome]|uniref:Lipoprotein n=1 Tax=hydrothermal vent metagenome TaxID=652676 RepID=A0A1W1CSC3_9ZZZZ